MSPPTKPSRGAARFHASLPAIAHYADRSHACSALNLSRTGVLLIGPLPRPPGSSLTLTLMSASGDLEFKASGRVLRIEAGEEENELQLGIEFDRIDPRQRTVLEALVSRVIEGVVPAALESLPPGASDQQIQEALAKIPLGHRIGMATRAMPKDRELLLRDTSPQVLEALARNPNLLGHEVRTMLRMVHLLPTTLEVLAREAKWVADEEVKILIATHPRVTMPLAERLVGSLSPEGVQKIMGRPGLHPGVRAKFSRKVPKRPPGR